MTNYLTFAKARGARIFSEVHVRRLAREQDDWIVELASVRGPLRSSKLGTVRAKIVVLCAGSLGSTEILLRSREGLSFSPRLGARFSANADIMAMSYNRDVQTDVLAYGTTPRNTGPVGPSIGSFGDFRRGGSVEAARWRSAS